MAGDTATIIYAAPLAYVPVVAYVYDADENRDINPSLSLEILPFQDQLSNLLTQYLLTVQRNLDNATFIDTDQVDEKDIKVLENAGQRAWTGRNYIRYSGKRNMRAQQTIPQAVFNTQFPALDANGVVTAMRAMLDMLERVLVMSSQEVAQAASHEQTREEVKNIQQNTSTRLKFTQTPVDLATEAWKRQIYAGLMAYGSEDFYSFVAYDNEITPALLKELGFTTVEQDEDKVRNRRVYLKGSRSAVKEKRDATSVMLESFAATRDEGDRISDSDTAGALMQFLMASVNTEYGVCIGGDQYIELLNEIGQRSGAFNRDFKLTCKFDPTKAMVKKMEGEAEQAGKPQQGDQSQQMMQAIMQQVSGMLQQAQQQTLQQVGQAIKPLGDTVEKTVQGLQALGQMLDQKVAPALQQALQMSQGGAAAAQQNAKDIAHIALTLKSIEEFISHANPPPGMPTGAPAPELQPA